MTMEKRDLKADLEQVRNFRSRWRQSTSPEEDWKIGVVLEDFCRDKAELWLDQALAEKERADKAEALARELVGVIDDLCRQINQCGLDEQMWEVYRTAKEVLGDDSQGDNRAT
jgi:hypothetical protein